MLVAHWSLHECGSHIGRGRGINVGSCLMCRSDIHLAAVAALISAYAFRWRHRRICTSLQIPNPPLITCHYGDKKKRTQTSAHSLVLSVSLSLVVSFINSFILSFFHSFIHCILFFKTRALRCHPLLAYAIPQFLETYAAVAAVTEEKFIFVIWEGAFGIVSRGLQAAVAARCIHSQQQCKSKCPPYMAPSSQCLCNLACLCPYSSSSA